MTGSRVSVDYKSGRKPNKLHSILNWAVDLTAVVAMACFLVFSFATRVTMNGSSMSPVLDSGDVVLANRMAYGLGRPKRFDIAAFSLPGSGTNIKRVIGLPGETVYIADNRIYIDGDELAVPEAFEEVTIPGIAEYPTELGPDEYFMLGDNHESSEDSRFAAVGMVKDDQLIGKVWLKIRPLSGLGPVK